MTTTTAAKRSSRPAARTPFTYEAALRDSLDVEWRVEDVLPEGQGFDFSRPLLPDGLVHARALPQLTDAEKLTLNHIRAKTYLYLFGFVEEFILPFVLRQAQAAVHGESARTRALVTFAEEEAKHIDLFRRFARAFDAGFRTRIDVIGPASEVAAKVLDHSPLGVALTTLHLEWLTQQHFVESVRADREIDPRFAKLLDVHWQEEAQHAKLDTLLVHELADRASPAVIERGIDDYLAIAGILDGGLAAQVDFDVDALERHHDRRLDPVDRASLVEAQVRSYRRTYLVSGARHPAFVQTIKQLSPEGAARIEAAADALAA